MNRFSIVSCLLLVCVVVVAVHGGAGNNAHTTKDATRDDQDMTQFLPVLTPYEKTVVKLTTDAFTPGSRSSQFSYTRNRITGTGPLWRNSYGVGAVWIDLRTGGPLRSLYKNDAELASIGIVLSGTRLTYNLTFKNDALTSFDLIHAHGVLASDWRTDGVPLLTDMPLAPGESRTYSYSVDLTKNTGTYFMHSHWGFGSMLGMSAPLIVQWDAPQGYPLKTRLDNATTVEVPMFLEDWCLQYTNADDVNDGDGTANPNDLGADAIRNPLLCQNPFLAYRAVWGEWNSFQRGQLYPTVAARNWTCEPRFEATEFGFAYFMANGKVNDDPNRVPVKAGYDVRLRIINAGSLTAFRVTIPPELNAQVISVDGHYIVPTTPLYDSAINKSFIWIAVGQRVDVLFAMPLYPATPQQIDTFPIEAFEEAPDPSTSSASGFGAIAQSSIASLLIHHDLLDDDHMTEQLASIYAKANQRESVDGIGMLTSDKRKPEIFQQEKLFVAFGDDRVSWNISDATTVLVMNLTGYNGIFGVNGYGWQLPPAIPLSEYLSGSYPNPHPFKVKRGDKVCLQIINHVGDPHPIHLHGHAFQVKQLGGVPVQGAMRDTVLVPHCENVTVCFDADKASDSVHSLHCHMGIHEMAGLHTTIEYEAYKPIPITYTGALPSTPVVYINNTVTIQEQGATRDVDNGDGRRVGLGTGLALGLALLLSWILFGYCFYRLGRSHRYEAGAGNPTLHRESMSMQQGKGGTVAKAHVDDGV